MFSISEHTCDVVKVKLEPHPNADSLSLVMIGDFQCAVRTSDWSDGDLAIYIPPDSVVPETKDFEFLGKHRRIRARKLRGEWSVGLLIPAPVDAKVGDDYMEQLGVVHYEPQVHGHFTTGGDNVTPPPGFLPNYDVLNFRKYSRLFIEGEEVIVTEKIHGCVNSLARISLPDGNVMTMQKLIDQDYDGEVFGYDFNSQCIVATKVMRVYKNGMGAKWLQITFDRHRIGRGSYFGSLKCTPNHRIFSTNHDTFIEADRLVVGDTIRLIRSELGLTPIQKQVLIGKMLGDGSYSHNDLTGFVRFSHKKDHGECEARILSLMAQIRISLWYWEDMMSETEIHDIDQPQCMYCYQRIPIKMIKNPNGLGVIFDPEDARLQEDLHLAESPGCAALHRVMSKK